MFLNSHSGELTVSDVSSGLLERNIVRVLRDADAVVTALPDDGIEFHAGHIRLRPRSIFAVLKCGRLCIADVEGVARVDYYLVFRGGILGPTFGAAALAAISAPEFGVGSLLVFVLAWLVLAGGNAAWAAHRFRTLIMDWAGDTSS